MLVLKGEVQEMKYVLESRWEGREEKIRGRK